MVFSKECRTIHRPGNWSFEAMLGYIKRRRCLLAGQSTTRLTSSYLTPDTYLRPCRTPNRSYNSFLRSGLSPYVAMRCQNHLTNTSLFSHSPTNSSFIVFSTRFATVRALRCFSIAFPRLNSMARIPTALLLTESMSRAIWNSLEKYRSFRPWCLWTTKSTSMT